MEFIETIVKKFNFDYLSLNKFTYQNKLNRHKYLKYSLLILENISIEFAYQEC